MRQIGYQLDYTKTHRVTPDKQPMTADRAGGETRKTSHSIVK